MNLVCIKACFHKGILYRPGDIKVAVGGESERLFRSQAEVPEARGPAPEPPLTMSGLQKGRAKSADELLG
jgi:hypothetical protein